MAQEQDWLYYSAREMISRRMASKALNPAIGRIHEDLANGYATKVLENKPVGGARDGRE